MRKSGGESASEGKSNNVLETPETLDLIEGGAGLSMSRDGWCHMQMEQTTIKSQRKEIDFLNPSSGDVFPPPASPLTYFTSLLWDEMGWETPSSKHFRNVLSV